MSDALFIPLADAVAAMLTAEAAAGNFSRQFTAGRVYDPLEKLETMERMRVDVILGDRKCEPLNRAAQKETLRIEIAIRQVLRAPAKSSAEKRELDELVCFMEEIDRFVSAQAQRRPPTFPAAAWQGSELIYPFLPGHLREERQFVSLLRLTYLAFTT